MLLYPVRTIVTQEEVNHLVADTLINGTTLTQVLLDIPMIVKRTVDAPACQMVSVDFTKGIKKDLHMRDLWFKMMFISVMSTTVVKMHSNFHLGVFQKKLICSMINRLMAFLEWENQKI